MHRQLLALLVFLAALAGSGCGSTANPSSSEEPVGNQIRSSVSTAAGKRAEKGAGDDTATTSTSSNGHYVNVQPSVSSNLKDQLDQAVKMCRDSAKQVEDRTARAQILETCNKIR